MARYIDMTGEVFGKWTVLEQAGRSSSGQVMWLCRCECGTERAVGGSYLRNYSSLSCGRCHVNDVVCKVEGCDRPRMGRDRLCSRHHYETYKKKPSWMKDLVARRWYDR